MHKTIILAALTSGALIARSGSLPPGPPAQDARTVAFLNVNVISMDRDTTLPRHTVVVRDDRIVGLQPAGDALVPRHALRIDGTGRFLMPGLIDMHVHLDDTADFIPYVAHGITTVRNMRGAAIHLAWRRRIATGELIAPSLFTTGPFLANLGSAAEATRAVTEQKRAGYQYLKVHGDIERRAYQRLVAEGRRHGLPVVGHLPRNLPYEEVLQAKPLSIDHAEEFLYTVFAGRGYSDSLAGVTASRTVAAGIAVTPTLVAYRHIVDQVARDDHLLKQPALRFVAPIYRVLWQPENNPYARRSPPTDVERIETEYRWLQDMVRALDAAGVVLLLGTDAMIQSVIPGESAHEELELLVAAGLSPYRALRAATRDAAVVLGEAGTIGTVTVGKRADLLLLNRNPLVDVTATRDIAGVALRGRWLAGAQLATLMENLSARYVADSTAVEELLKAGLEDAIGHSAGGRPMWSGTRLRLLDYRLAEQVAQLVEQVGTDSVYQHLRRVTPGGAVMPSEGSVNRMGYHRLRTGRIAAGIAVFRLNTFMYPASSNVWDSLGEALLVAGDTTGAAESYSRAVSLDPGNQNAIGVLQRIRRSERR